MSLWVTFGAPISILHKFKVMLLLEMEKGTAQPPAFLLLGPATHP